MNIDLTKLTVQELKNLLANQQRLERPTEATVVELARRGAATGSDHLTLTVTTWGPWAAYFFSIAPVAWSSVGVQLASVHNAISSTRNLQLSRGIKIRS
jgi:hypothetical protein